MSTPRRPWPRSRPAPMIATGFACGSVTRGSLDRPAVAERLLRLARLVEDDAERRELRPRDQVVELVGKAVEAGRGPAGGEVVDRERLHREGEVHDLDRIPVEAGDVDERAVDE